MTADEYIAAVLAKYEVPRGPYSPTERAARQVVPVIQSWAGNHLLRIDYSGSYAKETGVRGNTDVDLFISLASNTPGTLREIYASLQRFLAQRWTVEARNVSLRIQQSGVAVDLVPGQKQAGNTTDHSLYRRRQDTWMQTNVAAHIQAVTRSGRTDEIRAIKIWRQLNRLDFPSFFLELAVIQALAGHRLGALAANVWEVLGYLAERITSVRLLDPANTNNIVSDDLNQMGKRSVAKAAAQARAKSRWQEIIW